MANRKRIWTATDDGYYVGPSWADEDPMNPGTYLMPAGGHDVAPPYVPALTGREWRWIEGVDTNWKLAPARPKLVTNSEEAAELPASDASEEGSVDG